MIIIGHRGAMGYEPENTLISFQKAIDLRVDMIEFDVHHCRSGELVVIHDEKVNRTTDGMGFVAKKTLAELKELDAGKGEKIPTLEEALDLIDGQVKVNTELKGVNTVEATLRVIKKYIKRKGWTYDNFLVSSFDSPQLETLRNLDKHIDVAVAIDRDPLDYIEFSQKLKAYSIHPIVSATDKKFIKTAHQNNFKVFVWTVNPKEVQRMKDIGVDGIFMNYPDRLNG